MAGPALISCFGNTPRCSEVNLVETPALSSVFCVFGGARVQNFLPGSAARVWVGFIRVQDFGQKGPNDETKSQQSVETRAAHGWRGCGYSFFFSHILLQQREFSRNLPHGLHDHSSIYDLPLSLNLQ